MDNAAANSAGLETLRREDIVLRRIFRTRSPQRDSSTDAKRLDLIDGSIAKAIAECEAEAKGLAGRISDYHAVAASIVDATDYETREAPLEELAASSEMQAASAQRRLTEISLQLKFFRHLSTELTAFRSGAADHNRSPVDR